MYLIVGLGNPGGKYKNTRHNVGFSFLDFLSGKYGFSFTDSKWKTKICKTALWGESVIFAKPETFMNLSGTAVGQIAAYYKIPPEKIIAIHDDLDLSVGRIKMVTGRGAGGHKGIVSMISHLNSKEFARIRIGLGRPQDERIEVSSFVLGKIDTTDLQTVENLFDDIEHGLEIYIQKGGAAAMNFLNTLK